MSTFTLPEPTAAELSDIDLRKRIVARLHEISGVVAHGDHQHRTAEQVEGWTMHRYDRAEDGTMEHRATIYLPKEFEIRFVKPADDVLMKAAVDQIAEAIACTVLFEGGPSGVWLVHIQVQSDVEFPRMAKLTYYLSVGHKARDQQEYRRLRFSMANANGTQKSYAQISKEVFDADLYDRLLKEGAPPFCSMEDYYPFLTKKPEV